MATKGVILAICERMKLIRNNSICTMLKCVSIFAFSVIFFGTIGDKIKTDLFLVGYACGFCMLLLAFCSSKNREKLVGLFGLGVMLSVGFVFAKVIVNPLYYSRIVLLFSSIFEHLRECKVGFKTIGVSIIETLDCIGKFRVVLGAIIIFEYFLVIGQSFWKRKSNSINDNYNGKKQENGKENKRDSRATTVQLKQKLFKEREQDLIRLKEYLSYANIVGINDKWGNGKTFFVDKFIEKHRGEYEVVKIEPLTCNLEEIASYLFIRLEKALVKHRIYPTYSRKLQRILTKNNWLNQLFGEWLFWDCPDNMTAFEGFCKDLEKMDIPILLVWEDIDRISTENRDQIAKMFDLSLKLSEHNVKVVYEYDAEEMQEEKIGFQKGYFEKFVPYVITLTAVSPKKLIENAINEVDADIRNFKAQEAQYLFNGVSLGSRLGEITGLYEPLTLSDFNVTPRKMLRFLTETNVTLGNSDYVTSENRNATFKRAVITFFFMKHFFEDIYNKWHFETPILYRINRKANKADLGSSTVKRTISKKELINVVEDVVLDGEKISAIKEIGFSEEHKNRLIFLCLFGYDVDNAFEDTVQEQNEKIWRITNKLYMSGKSGRTDSEIAVEYFVVYVLGKDKTQWKTAWVEYKNKLQNPKCSMDNRTIFSVGEKSFVSLFRALYLYVTRTANDVADSCKQELQRKQQDIITKSLDFFRMCMDDEADLVEIVTVLNYCVSAILEEIAYDGEEIFFNVLECFNALIIKGKSNHSLYIALLQKRAYRDFISNCSNFAHKKGYVKIYEMSEFGLPTGLELTIKQSFKMFAERLEAYTKELEDISCSNVDYPVRRQRIELLKKFYGINLEIICCAENNP